MFKVVFVGFELLVADEVALEHGLGALEASLLILVVGLSLLNGDAQLLVLDAEEGVAHFNAIAFLDAELFDEAADLGVNLDCRLGFDGRVEEQMRGNLARVCEGDFDGYCFYGLGKAIGGRTVGLGRWVCVVPLLLPAHLHTASSQNCRQQQYACPVPCVQNRLSPGLWACRWRK